MQMQASPAQAPPTPLIERQLEVLSALMEAGLRMALGVEQQHADQQAGLSVPSQSTPKTKTATPDLALAFARASRAVRMTVALQARLLEERGSSDAAGGAPKQIRVVFVDPDNSVSRESLEARKAEVGRIVAGVAQASLQPGEHDPVEAAEAAERIGRETIERLDDDEFGALMRRPVSEIIDLICRDLGLSPDWPTLAQETWAQAEMSSGKTGAPLASFGIPLPRWERGRGEGDAAVQPMRPPDRWPSTVSP